MYVYNKDSGKDEKLKTSMSDVSKQIDLIIIGAGRGGLALLRALHAYNGINIQGVFDKKENAIAFKTARSLGIPVSTKITRAVKQFRGEVIVNATGDKNLGTSLACILKSREVELITDAAAMLIYNLASEQLEQASVINYQSTKLSLFEGMLDITLRLESQPPVEDISSRILDDLNSHTQSTKGAAVIFEGKESCAIVGSTDKRDWVNKAAASAIRTEANRLSDKDYFTCLRTPLKLIDQDTDVAVYNVMIPFRKNGKLAGVLLFDVPGELSPEQKVIFQMGGMHLNMVSNILGIYQNLEHDAMHDGLTKLYNRRFFNKKLKEELSRVQRNPNARLGCAFIDVDDFKSINDKYGHQAGDLVLAEIARGIELCTRDYDICVRYGGDEFVILFPLDAAHQNDCIKEIGLRILEYIQGIEISAFPVLKVSLSIGMAIVDGCLLDAGEDLLSLSDRAVYKAKKAGKSRLCFYINGQYQEFKRDRLK